MTQEQIFNIYIDSIDINLDYEYQLILAKTIIEHIIYDLDFTEYKKQQNRLITANEIIKEVLKNDIN